MDMLIQDIALDYGITTPERFLQWKRITKPYIHTDRFFKLCCRRNIDITKHVNERLDYVTNFFPCPFERRKIIKYAIPAVNYYQLKREIKARNGIIKFQRIFRDYYYRPGNQGFIKAETEYNLLSNK